ncbi:hypothetical protein [Halobacillus sp. A5]|uniref:hypothetical protein n=1 Tax=Halobacillus sp. A5 TaxID=2880263 RepID=UPI0020A6D81E|nr:hypothetical protein [Halobacillus sp. A5]MCP3028557.1 hypothetical protein [Halobacillus sp. A5]
MIAGFALNTSEILSLLLLLLSIITFMLSRLNYRASHAPIIAIQNRKYRISEDEEKNIFKITAKNIGNGICIDSLLLLREKDENNNMKYYLSKPVREIDSDDVIEFTIKKGPNWDEEAEFILVYVDFFGKKYTSNGVTEGEAATAEQLNRFVKPAKQLYLFHPTYLKFLWWRSQAVKQGNSAKEQEKTSFHKSQKELSDYKIDFTISKQNNGED